MNWGARYIFIYLVFSTGAFAQCPGFLSKITEIFQTRSIEKIIKKKTYYFNNLAQYQRGYDYRKYKYHKRSHRFMRFLKSEKELTLNQKQLLTAYWTEINKPELFPGFAREFFTEAAKKTLKGSNIEAINKLKEKHRLDRLVVFELLKERLVNENIGFRGFEEINRTYSPREFSEVLKAKRLIIDGNFRGMLHGEYVHIYQIAFMLFIAKKINIPVKTVSEVYEWLHNLERRQVDENTTFNPGHDGWVALFDSIENDLTNPQHFNPLLESLLF